MITYRINLFSYMHRIIRMFIVLKVIFNRVHLYLIWHESTESKKSHEEHMKHSYSMLSYMNINK